MADITHADSTDKRTGLVVTNAPPMYKAVADLGTGRFGDFGGRYIPETLMAAHEELERVYVTCSQVRAPGGTAAAENGAGNEGEWGREREEMLGAAPPAPTATSAQNRGRPRLWPSPGASGVEWVGGVV